LIGLGAASLLYFNGRIAGISGIFGGLLQGRRGDTLWRFSFIAGLLVGGLILMFFHPASVDIQIAHSAPAVLLAGLLVGIGTRMGSGCTSGHGICGISRLAPRSLIATAVFMFAGIAAATIIKQAMGGIV